MKWKKVIAAMIVAAMLVQDSAGIGSKAAMVEAISEGETGESTEQLEVKPEGETGKSEETNTEGGKTDSTELGGLEEESSTETVVPEGTEVVIPESTEEIIIDGDVGSTKAENKMPDAISEVELLKKQPAVIEVTDLSSFIQAVREETAEDEVLPAYEFNTDEAAVVVNGESIQMKDASRMVDGSFYVPSEVFSSDEMVDEVSLMEDENVSLEAVAESSDYILSEDETGATLTNIFEYQRLIVISEEGFDPYGAETIIQGFDNIFVLSYRSVEETKAAYEYLKTIPYLTVEVDASFASSAGIENSLLTGSDRMEKSLADEVEALHEDAEIGEINEQESRDIKVAVIDSGYDAAGANIGRMVDGVDLTGVGDIADTNGHGTAMANIILGNTKEKVKVMPVKVADETGNTTSLKIYLGILYALEKGADIVNLSMAAYKSTGAEIVARAVREAQGKGVFVVVSAGNSGEDTEGYTPANVQEAITVSAINADETRNEYSNYGSSIDYCSYGAVKVKGLGNQEVTATGTSISAAIVSAVVAEVKRQNNDMAYDAVLALLNEKAKDLGEPGKDSLFGNGVLTLETIQQLQEDKLPKEVPELMTCDWKNLSDDALNELIAGTDYVFLRKFLDRMTEEDKKALLSRDVMFHNNHVTVEYDEKGQEVYRDIRTLYDYLYSKDYAEYQTQYYIYHANMTAKVKLNTSLDGRNGEITVYAPGIATNPVDNDIYKKGVKVGGTSGGAIHVEKVSFKRFETFTDDNGHVDTIGQYGVQDVVIDKPQGYHLNMVSSGGRYEYGGDWWSKKYTPPKGSWTGGYTQPSAVSGKSCSTNSVTADFMVGEWDFVAESGGKSVNQQYTLNFQGGSIGNSYGGWQTTKDATCTTQGNRIRTVTHTCAKCEASFRGADEPGRIPARGHTWGGAYNYETNNGIANGYRYEHCLKNCYESGWTRGPQFLHQIFYRFMDVDGNYGGYTQAVNGYYDSGAGVPGWYFGGSLEHLPTGIGSYPSVNANYLLYDVPRKKYNIVYDGNGATGGGMGNREGMCVGKYFALDGNGFSRLGYDFKGWSRNPGGGVEFGDRTTVVNLSVNNGEWVRLYAIWEPHVYTIRLDNQGANIDTGTNAVYQKYVTGYFENPKATIPFSNNKIRIPEKYIDDTNIFGGQRMMQFLGYYTGKDGSGDAMVKKDGSLIANMAGRGNYAYFTNDATVYAQWIPKYAIQFSDNLTDADRDIVGTDGNNLPATKWKNKGESITVSFEPASIKNSSFTPIYRLKGWSLTPEILSEDEIILSKGKASYTFTADEDVTLYAQWDTSFHIAYVGNTQSEGTDYLEGVASVRDTYIFTPNDKEDVEALENPDADYFLKTIEKSTVDKATGDAVDENGVAYKETIPYSFQGWSMVNNKHDQDKRLVYEQNQGENKSDKVILDAEAIAAEVMGKGLTFGEPVSDYGSHNAAHDMTRGLLGATKGKPVNEYTKEDVARSYAADILDSPFVNMYSIWDQFPQIEASDLYFPLVDAQNGLLTEENLLNEAKATDEELKKPENTEGILKNGVDDTNKTSFTILDYQESDFTGAEGNISMTITYRAEDSVGNVTTKTVEVYLVDTTAEKYDAGEVRFISKGYADTLSENSIWRTGDYAAKLSEVLGNSKSGEEYTVVTPVEQALGVKSVLKPGSGDWSNTKQVWEFTHDQVLEVQSYVKEHGIKNSQDGFLASFGSCRIR